MLRLQIVPRSDIDGYRLLRDKVTFEAKTWAWKNKTKTRMSHTREPKKGYIEIGSVDGVVVAEIRPTSPDDAWFLAEKFIGRLVAWFPSDIVAINMQFQQVVEKSARNARRK